MNQPRRGQFGRTWIWGAGLLLGLLAASQFPRLIRPAASLPIAPAPGAVPVPVAVTAMALNHRSRCSNTFVAHPLEHVTTPHGEEVRRFETNGTGVAINDLNGDGLLDLVLANLDGPATLLWNQGQLKFEREILDDHNTRAVNIVDVEGDGRLDIVLTHVATTLSYWRNLGPTSRVDRPTFAHAALAGVRKPAHAMAWGDLNGDGALDLVTGSYDAELNLQPGGAFLFGDGAGIYYYEQHHGTFLPQRLAPQSQALVIALFDANADRRLDILVGSDFDVRDYAWLWAGPDWQLAEPFAQTAHHTMSFDWGDIDNNGSFELFSTDMKPYDISVESMAEWLPLMASLRRVPRGDPQSDQNVLQVLGADYRYRNQSAQRGIQATGWSWSGKFGDLDNDGWLDLYVVNGMMDADLFDYLPGGELVEANQAFRNVADGTFSPAPHWGLGSMASGRGMSMADLDNDGDLDIVVNNLRSSAQLFENQVCGGSGLEVELRWPASANPYALGAHLVLRTSAGAYVRDVRAGSGYLSGDPARVHFGVPGGATLLQLDVLWPDGRASSVSTPLPNTLLTIAR